METEGGRVSEVLVEEEDDLVVAVVDESEGRDAAGLESQVAHHAFGRSEGQLAGGVFARCDERRLESVFQVVDSQVVVAIEADEVMHVALMVAEEEVLAMDRPVVVPPAFGLLDGLAFGVSVVGVGDVMLLEIE